MEGFLLNCSIVVSIAMLVLAQALRKRNLRWAGLALLGVNALLLAGPFVLNRIRPAFIGPHIERLKGYVAPEVLAAVDPRFFTHAGYWDDWRFPLAYPFESEIEDNPSCAVIADQHGQVPALIGVTELAFDGRFLLVRKHPVRCATAPVWEGRAKWGLFEFATGKTAFFDTEAELDAEAAKQGYTGNMKLRTIGEAYRGYFYPG